MGRLATANWNAMAEFGLARYLNELRQLPMLEPQEGYLLAKRWREHGDREAAHRLVTSHLRLVVKRTSGPLNADGDMRDNIDAKMRGHRPFQPVAPVQCAKHEASSPV
jgi:hypothetical protein